LNRVDETRNKNDAADAEAICEAVRRPTMRFVRIDAISPQFIAAWSYAAQCAGQHR
jgi:transposase